MSSLLIVFADLDAQARHEPVLRERLKIVQDAPIESTICHLMVQRNAGLNAQQVLIYLPIWAAEIPQILQAWGGQPPCAVSLMTEPLVPSLHEELVRLGVHAWSGIDAPDLPVLLASARARWQREAALREALTRSLAELAERKWVDRAKGVMQAGGVSEAAAFSLLRGAAMHANLRVGEVSRAVVEAAQWAEAINRAGQLRMLSQRLVRVAAQMLLPVDAKRGRVLRTESVGKVQETLAYLGGLAHDAETGLTLQHVARVWETLHAALGQPASLSSLQAIDLYAEALLVAAERLTTALEEHGARRSLRIINTCGRQRMRAQRVAKDALLATIFSGGEWGGRLQMTLTDFEIALLELEDSPLRSNDIGNALASARDEWARLLRSVRRVERLESRSDVVAISDALTGTFDRLTAAYEHSVQVIMS